MNLSVLDHLFDELGFFTESCGTLIGEDSSHVIHYPEFRRLR